MKGACHPFVDQPLRNLQPVTKSHKSNKQLGTTELVINVEELTTRISDLESFFQDLLCFGSTDGAVDSNLFISADTEGSHSVAGCKETSTKVRHSAEKSMNRVISYKTAIRSKIISDGVCAGLLGEDGQHPLS